MSITRRQMIATSGAGLAAGGAAVVLSACGGDGRQEPTAEGDVELLSRALAAETTVLELYDLAETQHLAGPVATAAAAFGEQTSEHVELLSQQIEAAGGAPSEDEATPPEGESVVEAIRIALDQAIATEHEIVGTLSAPDARRAVYRVMTADAAQLAAIRGVLGEEQVPVAFVTGGPEPPLGADGAGGAEDSG